MFAKLFFYKNKFKPLVFTNASLYEVSKDKLNNVIKISEKNRLNYLTSLDKKFKSSLIIFGIVIFLTFISFTSLFQNILVHVKLNLISLLEKYNLWWQSLPKYISFFLPSKIIYWFPSFPTFILITIMLLVLRTMLPIFQYRNRETTKKDFINIIFNNFTVEYFLESNIDSLNINNFYKHFSLPSYDGIIVKPPFVSGKYKNCNFKFVDINFYIYDKISHYRPKVKVLSGLIMAIELDFKKEDFLVYISKLDQAYTELKFFENTQNFIIKENRIDFSQKEIFYNSDHIMNIVTLIMDYMPVIQNYNNTKEKKFFDDKIAEFLAKNPKENFSDLMQVLQLGVIENQLFIFMPSNREIFRKKSIFAKSVVKEDIDLLITYFEMSFRIIDLLKITQN
ncbi:MAG: hypothetical protein ACK4OM_07375 [Alphaproteobacteria bacterium]